MAGAGVGGGGGGGWGALGDVEGEGFGGMGIEVLVGPAEAFGEEGAEIGEAEVAFGVALEHVDEGAVIVGGEALEALGLDEGGDADDEALDGLDHAEPGFVKAFGGVAHGGGAAEEELSGGGAQRRRDSANEELGVEDDEADGLEAAELDVVEGGELGGLGGELAIEGGEALLEVAAVALDLLGLALLGF